MHRFNQYIAICSGLLLLLPVIAQGEHSNASNQMSLSISTDKRAYYPGEIAVYTVKFTNSDGKSIDPDLIRATYNSQFIRLEKVDDGVYSYATKRLTRQDNQLGVYGEKDGYNFVQESLTIRPIIGQKAGNHVKATFVQQGDLLKLRLSNDILSQRSISKIMLSVTGATIESVASSSWIRVPNHLGTDLKSVYGSIEPGEKQTIKLVVEGKASMVVWKAFDHHGKSVYTGTNNVFF